MFPDLIDLQFKSLLAVTAEELTMPPPLCFIRSLNLELANLLLLYVEHFTSGLPRCLDTLEITLTGICFDDWFQEIGEDQALQFAARSSNISAFKFSFATKIPPTRAQQLIVGRSPEPKITSFYYFLNILNQNRKVSTCRAEFDAFTQHETIISVGSSICFF